MNDSHRYDDIIRLPHHVSSVHPQMPVSDRAAQFAPFAALTGHGAAIRETARLTGERMELEDDVKTEIDGRLQMIRERIAEHPEVTVSYFVPDERKDGGRYRMAAGAVKKIDEYRQMLILADGTQIPLEELAAVHFVYQ